MSVSRKMFSKLRTRLRYYKLLRCIEDVKIYDGRGKGIDVYVCEECGKNALTRYADKGVTPFVIRCRNCGGDSLHRKTFSEHAGQDFALSRGLTIWEWVRPPLKDLWNKNSGYVDYVLKGGLVLKRDECKLKNSNPET